MDWTAIVSAAIAAISALVSIFLAAFNARRGEETQKAMAALQDRLAGERSLQDARIEYEFRARQRLYDEVEPFRFQLLDAVETGKCQIEAMSELSLERNAARLGSAPAGNYRLLGTIYHLLHPAALYRIAQRRLTLVDLRIDKTIQIEYTLAKCAYLTLSHDARMSEVATLPYTPYVGDWREKRELSPAMFRRQGLPLGRLDNALSTLIVGDEAQRIATFGEFEARSKTSSQDGVSGPVGAARDLFDDFSPLARPILWRLLLSQFAIYRALLASITRNEPVLELLLAPWRHLKSEERAAFGLQPDPSSLPTEFRDVTTYLQVHVVPKVRAITG